jgi:hypothetical protein
MIKYKDTVPKYAQIDLSTKEDVLTGETHPHMSSDSRLVMRLAKSTSAGLFAGCPESTKICGL